MSTSPELLRPGLFRDRREAGRQLAAKLAKYAGRPDVIVLALPRGGVPVAYEVARALGAPLDVFVVRKLGVPGYEELAMGAVATGGVRVLNDQLVNRLGIPERLIDAFAAREQQELARRERLYRDGRPPPRRSRSYCDFGGRWSGNWSHHARRDRGAAIARTHCRRCSDRVSRSLRGDESGG
jgi:hypothetical protein